jgi:hypothetical protein
LWYNIVTGLREKPNKQKEKRKRKMKKMYRAEYERYTDIEGRYTAFKAEGELKATLEEAKALVANMGSNFPLTGTYRVVEVAMDEATFTYAEQVIYEFNYYREVKRFEMAKEDIARYERTIAELEAGKKRVRTEKGMAKKEKEIAYWQEWLDARKAQLEKWTKEMGN